MLLVRIPIGNISKMCHISAAKSHLQPIDGVPPALFNNQLVATNVNHSVCIRNAGIGGLGSFCGKCSRSCNILRIGESVRYFVRVAMKEEVDFPARFYLFSRCDTHPQRPELLLEAWMG